MLLTSAFASSEAPFSPTRSVLTSRSARTVEDISNRNADGFLFFCDCCMCDVLNYRCWRGLRICRLLRVREKLRCDCAWMEPEERIFLSTARCGCRSNRIRQLIKVKRGDTTIHFAFDMTLVNYSKMSHFLFH